MRLSKLVRGVMFVTLIALVYIHLQMQIYHLAYLGQEKKDHIQRLTEANAMLAYQILELKSVHHLGQRLLASDQPLRFRDNQSVIQLVTADVTAQEEPAQVLRKADQENSLLNFLTVKAEARNHPPEERNLFRILGKDM